MTTKVLLVGGGAREHAMAEAIVRSGGELYAILKNRNPGIIRLAKGHALMSETEAEAIADKALEWGVQLAVVGPEAPLEAGVSDSLAEVGIPCASPSKKAAEIESSKAFMRKLLEDHAIPGRVQYRVFDNPRGLKTYIDRLGDVVVKPVGLTGGKGVKVMGEHLADSDEAAEYAKEILDTRLGGAAKVLIEERCVGEEFSIMAFCDGNVAVPMPAIQDHKRAYEGDQGPNTGGMGTYSGENGLLPFLTKHDYEEAALIVQKILDALKAEGRAYTGAIYGQFMLTADGPRVIEVNARFGDPEAMNALTLLDSNYVDILWAMVEGSLSKQKVRFKPDATVCKYVVPEGYGTKSKVGVEIKVDQEAVEKAGAKLYYAAVNEEEGRILTTTSRSIGVVAAARTIGEANDAVEAALKHITGDHLYVRHDIGTKELVQKRVQHMRELRGH